MPMATIGYIEDDNGTAGNSNDDFWRECVNNDVSSGWVATIGDGSSQANIDQINVSRTGITYNSNIENLINYDSSDGKSEADYIPTNNVTLVDAGISPTNSVDTNSMGGSDTLDNLIPHTNVGSASDIGAFEYGATAVRELIGLQNSKELSGKLMLHQQIGIRQKIGQLEMYQLLMFMF